MTKATIQMTHGDDVHLTLLMAPHSLNFFTGQDREHLLAFGRAAFEAGKATAEQGKCLHQIAESGATPFMHGIADGCGNACFEEGCVAPEANDLQPEVDGLNSCLDEDEAPYRVVALYAHPAQLSAVQTTKVLEALEMLENGALNVAESAKNRGDDYGVGYAQAMAKMARDTLDVLSAPARPAEGVPAFMPAAHPHHCTARTADGSCEECEGHAQAMAEWNAERTALATTQSAAQGMDALHAHGLQERSA